VTNISSSDPSTSGGRITRAFVLIASAALGCREEERPAPPAGAPLENARRVSSGRFERELDAGASGAAADAGDRGAEAVRSTEIYHGECDAPGVVQWGFLTFVTSTPGDSSIVFRLRSAPSVDALESADFIELITASSALGTRRCSVTGPAPCPIDLYDVLGGPPLAHQPYSELEITFHPSADGAMPSIDDWLLNYSCTFNQ
jgi:hypothetical protein